jgi:mono/diheme cytochrome c family protein
MAMSSLSTLHMSRLRCAGAAAMLLAAGSASAGYPEDFKLGTPASADEVRAVAIAVRPDGKGLPAGSGTWAAGKKVYEAQCIACHGVNLQGVAGFAGMPAGEALRLIGGRGTLTTPRPVLSVESYWPYAATLFDYIRRAMPFQAPGSLSNDDVYAVSAYILGESNIIGRAEVMSARTLPLVKMPNREGFILDQRPEQFKSK